MNRSERRRQKKGAQKSKISRRTRSRPNSPYLIIDHQKMLVEQAIEFALQFHTSGDFARAENIYQQILNASPDQPFALNLLGTVAYQTGRHDMAVDLLSKSIRINSELVDAHYNLANALIALGRLDEAVDSYKKAISLNPNDPDSHNNLGNVLKELERPAEAVISYKRSLELESYSSVTHCNLGSVFQELGKFDEAASSYQKAHAIKPKSVEILFSLSDAFRAQNKTDDAVASLGKILIIDPINAEAHSNLGNLFNSLGKYDEAVLSYKKSIELKPGNLEVHYNFGSFLLDHKKLDDAVEYFQNVISLDPEYIKSYFYLGIALQGLGDLDKSLEAFRKVVAIDPGYADAHRHLSFVKKFSEYDSDIVAMETAFEVPGIDDEQKIHLAFGLGKSFEDLKEYEKAFDYFLMGNALKRQSYEFCFENNKKFFASIRNQFTKDFFANHEGSGSSDETPVFILGMPRSGTSLVEQILASHPEIHGAGELVDLEKSISLNFSPTGGKKFIEDVSRARADTLVKAANDYLSSVRRHSGAARSITDKMPHNFLFIGMIKLMLPNAKIIHCRRDPRDTCLSIFKNLFTADGHTYSNDLSELGQYYKLYDGLMDYWNATLPGFIYEIQYEDMVADQKNQSRALIAHCGLEWNDACLSFHKSDRPVTTASAVQVRSPIFKSSVQSWKNYEPWLSPLLEAL